MKRNEFEASIVARAWKDEAFRKRLKDDPRAVLEEEIKKVNPDATLPENVKVDVLEETVDQIYLVVPVNPEDFHDGELSDEDLLNVAGGSSTATVAGQVQVAGPTLDVVAVVGGPTTTVVGPVAVVVT